ncbi:MAG: hypothetical protein Q9166_000497 [cf. Caloplaca sp. 2 TL-2023]
MARKWRVRMPNGRPISTDGFHRKYKLKTAASNTHRNQKLTPQKVTSTVKKPICNKTIHRMTQTTTPSSQPDTANEKPFQAVDEFRLQNMLQSVYIPND